MRRRFALLLCAVLAPLALWALLPVGSQGAGIGQLERKIEKTREKLGRKKGAEKLLTSEVTQYTRRIRRLEGRIGRLRSRQRSLQEDLDLKRAELARTQERLRSERARLARLRARLVVARRALARRLVELYKADKPDALTVVLNSEGFAELLERTEFIGRIADQDRRVVTVVRRARADAKRTAERLDRLERRQQELTAIVLARRNQVLAVKKELIGTRVGYQSTREDKRRALGKVRRDRQQLQRHVEELERESAAVRSRLAAVSRQGAPAGPIRRGSGQMIWPVNGALTSPFGMRWGRLHAGVDIGAPEGTPIRAADSGRVVLLGWTGGYGNYTCVQHSGSLSTCYAHQSRYATAMGASVGKGRVIGYVGNTGNSFGAHLHFEVRVNGSPVDPMGYL